ncbi:MAG: DUF4159 domain-containing protein, partial [Verrucomicrobia bacterium]|nr:DUF4159 domain-containing protein [Verrucomicrobiota bacterium]
MTSRKIFLLLAVATLTTTICLAQRWRGRGGPIHYTEGGYPVDERTVKTAREIASHSTGTPEWTNEPAFSRDVWTFCRIIRDRDPYKYDRSGSWITDFPDSDLNLSWRVQQMTSIKVNPDGRTIRLTDPELKKYPWIYMVEPGALLLRDEEVPILRDYLLNGGFYMVDDFWGEWQWEGFYMQMKRVFPDREFVELEMTHPIFHCVFDIKLTKNQMQVPNERLGREAGRTGVTWETHPQKDGSLEECRNVHFRAIFDDKGRMM